MTRISDFFEKTFVEIFKVSSRDISKGISKHCVWTEYKKIWTLGFAVARKRRFTRQVARKVFSLSNSLALFVWHSAKKWISELPEYRRGRHSVALYQIDGVAFCYCCYQSDKLSIMKHWCFYRKLFEASKNSVKSTQTLPSWINNIGFERACSIFALMHCLYRQRSNSLTKHSDFFAKKPVD